MIELLKNPVTYILIVNIFALFWGIRSWKKSIREKWMSNLRDAGANLIGAAEQIYAEVMNDGKKLQSQTMSTFIATEQKLLLLFAHDKGEKKIFEIKSESLRKAAESADTQSYRNELGQFSHAISDRILKEWKAIK